MGKTASLNGVRGDVMIPNVVQDEHSLNTYLFQNASRPPTFRLTWCRNGARQPESGQRAGNLFTNSRVMDVVYREAIRISKWRAGPYLSAVYEMYRAAAPPPNIMKIVNLYRECRLTWAFCTTYRIRR